MLLGLESTSDPALRSSPADERLGLLRQRRLDVEQGRGFAELMAEMRMTLGLDRLVYYSHWITPEALPQRFDTRFFLAELPTGEEATPSPFEMAEGVWIAPARALEQSRERAFSLHFATANHLRRLAPHQSLEDLFAFARTKRVISVMPQTSDVNGRIVPFLPRELEGVW
ncbi:MAG: hypothetical protein GEU73_02950 [Chloroflexi bacterium]|nr:hypothetical protein [Chloroflexota bacterium]